MYKVENGLPGVCSSDGARRQREHEGHHRCQRKEHDGLGEASETDGMDVSGRPGAVSMLIPRALSPERQRQRGGDKEGGEAGDEDTQLCTVASGACRCRCRTPQRYRRDDSEATVMTTKRVPPGPQFEQQHAPRWAPTVVVFPGQIPWGVLER